MKNTNFARQFAKLNPEQKEAVEAIEGPVMVLAGPGTGKTQVVAMRIGQILSKTQASPRNILALTFTEAGVTALRQRLIDLIGADAYQVTVATFHSFANEVILTFPYAFELPDTNSNLDELETYQIVDKIVRSLPNLDLLRPARAPNHHVGAIISAIKTLKQEAVSPSQLSRLAKSPLPTEDKTTASVVETVERHRQVLQELVLVYRAYQQHLSDHQLYDYEDMILWVYRSLSTKPEIKQYLQERYQYILVDEYQDTNNAQNAFVERLADFFDKPNLFVVGDDKQAIYRFQGASVVNMLHFAKKYPDIKTIALKINYRNPKPVIDSATKLIANNHQQLSNYLSISTELTSASTVINPPRLITFNSNVAQLAGIVEMSQKRIEDGLNPSEVAILFRSNKEVQEFCSFASRLGLAVAGSVSINILFEPIVQALINILRAIDDPTNSYSVLAALPYLDKDVSAIEISKALGDQHSRHLLFDGLRIQRRSQSVSRAASALRELIINQKEINLPELLLAVIDQCCLTTNRKNTLSLDALEIIHAFLDKARLLNSRNPNLSVGNLVEYFQLLRDYKISLPVKRALPEENGVKVMTVHAAKGLEFATVIMANVGADSWKVRANRSIIKLPSAIADVKNWREDQLEDERRLFYVGMTRAKTELVLSLSRVRENGLETIPSIFITEIDSSLKKEEVIQTPPATKSLLTKLLQPVSSTLLTSQQNKYIKEKILNSPFSYTHYRAYLTCPRQYLLRNILKMPEPASFSLKYGATIHKALELYFKKFGQLKVRPSKDQLITNFVDVIKRELTGLELTQTLKKGTELLADYYDRKSESWTLPAGVEYNFYNHHVQLDNIWLTGKYDRIDLIDPLARTVRVVDYKTGSKPKTRGQIEGTTKDSDGEIKQQLVFYALLAKHDRLFPFLVKELVISWVDDNGKFTDEVFTVTAEEISALEKSVVTTFEEIRSRRDFPHLGESFERGCELCVVF